MPDLNSSLGCCQTPSRRGHISSFIKESADAPQQNNPFTIRALLPLCHHQSLLADSGGVAQLRELDVGAVYSTVKSIRECHPCNGCNRHLYMAVLATIADLYYLQALIIGRPQPKQHWSSPVAVTQSRECTGVLSLHARSRQHGLKLKLEGCRAGSVLQAELTFLTLQGFYQIYCQFFYV